MTKAEFTSMAESHGLKTASDGRAIGTVQGYPVGLGFGGKRCVTVSVRVAEEVWREHRRELKERLRTFGKDLSVGYMAPTLTVRVKTGGMTDVWSQGIIRALDVLKEQRIPVPGTCPVCGVSGCDILVPSGAACTPAHRACLEKQVGRAVSSAEHNAKHGSYAAGFFGAFLGMLVGILPSIASILLVQRIYVVLFALIPLASWAGYKLLHGKMNYAALLFSVVFSILGVFMIQFITQYYYVMDYYSLSLADSLELLPVGLRDPAMWSLVLESEDLASCLIFVALGIVLAWSRISRTSKTEIRSARQLLDSSVPYGHLNGQGGASQDGYDRFDY